MDLHPGLKLSDFVAVEIKNINLKCEKLKLALEFGEFVIEISLPYPQSNRDRKNVLNRQQAS